jgi:hypothetical protein
MLAPLQHQKRDDAPMPSYFSFVFTSIDGDRVHVACLQFYEIMPDHCLRSLEVRLKDSFYLLRRRRDISAWTRPH